jgi:hypothetical protein
VNLTATEVLPCRVKPPKGSVFTLTLSHRENHAEDNASGIVPDADSLRTELRAENNSLENYALHALVALPRIGNVSCFKCTANGAEIDAPKAFYKKQSQQKRQENQDLQSAKYFRTTKPPAG